MIGRRIFHTLGRMSESRRLASHQPQHASLELRVELEALRYQIGCLESHRVKLLDARSEIQRAEFKVFSQWGEDGIIQYLINQVPIENQVFVEIGVQDYRESNTRFLLMHDNWRGLVIDSADESIEYIRNDSISWRYDLTARTVFITRDNVNETIEAFIQQGVPDIGLLSIDIDGNDYWVWKAIETITPRIVVCEYNSVFGKYHAVTVPYKDEFVRGDAHYSGLYYGASLPALCSLAKKKDYVFVGSNSAGNNAFFVRKDVASMLREMTAGEGYVESKFRESRDRQGRLSYLGHNERLAAIVEMPVVEINTNRQVALRELMQSRA